MKTNEELKDLYEGAYKDGKGYADRENSFFTFPTSDITEYILNNVDFKGKDVLEVGCGTGETAVAIANNGARSVLAVDYSEEAVKTCCSKFSHPAIEYKVKNYKDIVEQYDIVVLQEVIEHLDNPEEAILELMGKIRGNGILVVTCPNFTNIRGYIWMTLQILFNVPMSLSDLHFLSPFDFEEIAEKNNLNLKWSTFAHDRVTGEKLRTDMSKRLKNALRDAGMDNSKVDDLMRWISKVVALDNKPNKVNGGKGFYIFSRRELCQK